MLSDHRGACWAGWCHTGSLSPRMLYQPGWLQSNPSTQQKVPPSEGQRHPERLSSWGVARGEFSRACAPSSATVYAFQPPQVFREEPSSTNVPNESVKEQP